MYPMCSVDGRTPLVVNELADDAEGLAVDSLRYYRPTSVYSSQYYQNVSIANNYCWNTALYCSSPNYVVYNIC